MSIVETKASDVARSFSREELFIGGQWVKPSGDERIEVVNPTTGKVIGTVPQANEQDVDKAIAAAVKAHKSGPWRRMTFLERAEYLNRIADELEARSQDVSDAYVADFGGLVTMGDVFAHNGAELFRSHETWARQLPAGPERFTYGGVETLVYQEPVGPVLGIVPWNTTFFIGIVKLAPALLAGCPVIIKVAVENMLPSFVLADAINAAGLPEGLVSFLPGPREALGNITARPEFRHISFTGSTEAGIQIMKTAADSMAEVTLELGGKSAAIILDDMDPEADAPLLFPGTLMQSGQVCTTYSRLLVPRAKEDQWRAGIVAFFESLKVGDPSDPSTMIGPLVSASHRDSVEKYIQIAREEGATILTGGDRPDGFDDGFFVNPTLIGDVTNDMRIVQEEVFGPVITIQAYDSMDEAIELANSTQFGLAGGIFTRDEDRAIALAPRIEAGNLSVNLAGANAQLPFGGFKMSGIGREGGLAGVEALLASKQLQLKPVG